MCDTIIEYPGHIKASKLNDYIIRIIKSRSLWVSGFGEYRLAAPYLFMLRDDCHVKELVDETDEFFSKLVVCRADKFQEVYERQYYI